MSADYDPLIFELDEDHTPRNWTERFDQELLKGQALISDRLGPLSEFQMVREMQTRKYTFRQETTASGRGVFASVLRNSAQETAMVMVPPDQWLELLPWDGGRTFAAGLLEGSFGNTAEKEVGDLSPTYSASESWWHRASTGGAVRYGIRPRTEPYAYAGCEAGHFDGRPALSLEGRVRYLPFYRIQTSLAATVALPARCQLSLAALCEPTRLARTASTSVRLQHVVGSGYLARAAFVGLLHNSGETAVFCGFSTPW